VYTRVARKENPNPNPTSHDHYLFSKWKCGTVCAFSSVQLDKSRVEKEFTGLYVHCCPVMRRLFHGYNQYENVCECVHFTRL